MRNDKNYFKGDTATLDRSGPSKGLLHDAFRYNIGSYEIAN